MIHPNFICYNGEFIRNDNFIISPKNRAFSYGDGLFETIRTRNTEPLFYEDHIIRLKNGLKILELEPPANFDYSNLKGKIIRLLNANKHFKGARIRLTIYRKDGGLYTPEKNEFEYLIESNELENEVYTINQRGLVVDIYPHISKPINILSNCKSLNSLIFIKAGLYKKAKNIDECILLNENEHIVESISSNIFLVKKSKIYTPSLSEGCIDGIMRKQVISIAKKLNLEVFDNGYMAPEDLMLADELLLSNAITGIQWVVGYKQKRFYNKTAIEIIRKLNELILRN